MITITDEPKIDIPELYFGGYDRKDVLFFDIETTGFSPEKTNLYLIGCIFYQQSRLFCTQYFANSKDDEVNLLTTFFELMKNFKCVVSYNGEGFDIPYLLKKCRMHNLDYTFDNIYSLDIYKEIVPFKSFLKLENLKQKTIEQFLGIKREDKYSGGALIEYYHEYLKTNSKELFDMLILHNKEDLLGLTSVLTILSYPAIKDNGATIIDISKKELGSNDEYRNIEISIVGRLYTPVPKRISFGNDIYYIAIHDNEITLTVKAYTRELKYFYPNYKDYYYLPNEDTAIHKSVAFYVDKNFRTRAKAANCYSKKTGIFLPQYSEIVSPYFKIDYYDKTSYFEYTEEFINDNELIYKYLVHILDMRK